ncbi:MAG: hypothetical protein Q7R83_04550 [bacterium]|nr:hypothetical protein [bacterium]
MSLEVIQGGKSRRTPERQSPPPITPEIRRESIKASEKLAYDKRHKERLAAARAKQEAMGDAREKAAALEKETRLRELKKQLGPSKQELAQQAEAQQEAQEMADTYFSVAESKPEGKRDKKLETRMENANMRMEIAIDKEITASLPREVVEARTARALEIHKLAETIAILESYDKAKSSKEGTGETLTSTERTNRERMRARKEGYQEDIKAWEEARAKERGVYQKFHEVKFQMHKLENLVKTEYGTTISQLREHFQMEQDKKATQGALGKMWGGLKSVFKRDLAVPGEAELKQWEKFDTQAAAVKQELFELPRAAKKEVRGMGRVRLPDLSDRVSVESGVGPLFGGETRTEKKTRKAEVKEAKVQLERDLSNEHAELTWGKEGTIDAKAKKMAAAEGLTYAQAAEAFMVDGEEKFQENLESMQESQLIVNRILAEAKAESPDMPKFADQLDAVEKAMNFEFGDSELFQATNTYKKLAESMRTTHQEIDALSKRRKEGNLAGEKFMALRELQNAAEEALEKYELGKMSDAELAKEARILALKVGKVRQKLALEASEPMFKHVRELVSSMWTAKERRAQQEHSDRMAA